MPGALQSAYWAEMLVSTHLPRVKILSRMLLRSAALGLSRAQHLQPTLRLSQILTYMHEAGVRKRTFAAVRLAYWHCHDAPSELP